jgi:hypothetical protein
LPRYFRGKFAWHESFSPVFSYKFSLPYRQAGAVSGRAVFWSISKLHKTSNLSGNCMKRIITLIIFLLSLTNISLGQNKPTFKQQQYPSHGDSISFIPNLVGMTIQEAKITLRKHNIEIGAIIQMDDKILDSQIVYKQNPTSLTKNGQPNFVRQKQTIDLWVFDPNKNVDTLIKSNRKSAVVIENDL